MRASDFMARDGFARLRRRIAEIEGRSLARKLADSGILKPPGGSQRKETGEGVLAFPEKPSSDFSPQAAVLHLASSPRSDASLPFSIPKLDEALAGGLRHAALHELRAGESRDTAAMTGFAVAVLARLARSDARPVLWIVEAASAHEAGLPYGIGLGRFGFDPARLIVVRVAKPEQALWVFEEGLRCRGLAAVASRDPRAPASARPDRQPPSGAPRPRAGSWVCSSARRVDPEPGAALHPLAGQPTPGRNQR